MSTPTERTLRWVEDFVVRLNLCPFAGYPLRQQRVVCQECPAQQAETAFYWAGSQVQWLLDQPAELVETSLLLFTDRLFGDFLDFLDFVEEVEALLVESGGDALIQLAHFHPAYRFADVPADDPANATNRSPYPTIQLLRVASVAKAVAAHPATEGIPVRNAALLRQSSDPTA